MGRRAESGAKRWEEGQGAGRRAERVGRSGRSLKSLAGPGGVEPASASGVAQFTWRQRTKPDCFDTRKREKNDISQSCGILWPHYFLQQERLQLAT